MPTILPILFLFFLVVIFSVNSPSFLKQQNIMNIMRQSAILLIVASGTTFIILQGSIDLSIGSIVTLAGISGALLVRDADFGLWAVPLAMLVGASAGFLNGLIFSYGKVPSFLVTLGAMFVIEGIGLILCNGQAVQIWDRDYMKIAAEIFLVFFLILRYGLY